MTRGSRRVSSGSSRQLAAEQRMVERLHAEHGYLVTRPVRPVRRTVLLELPTRGHPGRGRARAAVELKLVVPEDSYLGRLAVGGAPPPRSASRTSTSRARGPRG